MINDLEQRSKLEAVLLVVLIVCATVALIPEVVASVINVFQKVNTVLAPAATQ